MKRTIVLVALCLGSAVSAQPPQASSATDRSAHAQEERQRRLALREHMGQLQLDMLIDNIVRSDEQARDNTRRADQMVASSMR